jgi:hypothetical protein
MVQAWVPTGLASYGVLALLFARGESGVAQPVSSGDVYVLDDYEEVCVGVLIRWLFRLVLFRVLVGLWRIFRRR